MEGWEKGGEKKGLGGEEKGRVNIGVMVISKSRR